jgi:hypothetical protein
MFSHTILRDGRKYHGSIQNKLAINRKLLFNLSHAQNCTYAALKKYLKSGTLFISENIDVEIRTENNADWKNVVMLKIV